MFKSAAAVQPAPVLRPATRCRPSVATDGGDARRPLGQTQLYRRRPRPARICFSGRHRTGRAAALHERQLSGGQRADGAAQPRLLDAQRAAAQPAHRSQFCRCCCRRCGHARHR